MCCLELCKQRDGDCTVSWDCCVVVAGGSVGGVFCLYAGVCPCRVLRVCIAEGSSGACVPRNMCPL